jgi:hypothetical protein
MIIKKSDEEYKSVHKSRNTMKRENEVIRTDDTVLQNHEIMCQDRREGFMKNASCFHVSIPCN